MSAIQIMCVIVGGLGVVTLFGAFLVVALSSRPRETNEDVRSGDEGTVSQQKDDSSAWREREALSAIEISEIGTQMKISGGYKPKPMAGDK